MLRDETSIFTYLPDGLVAVIRRSACCQDEISEIRLRSRCEVRITSAGRNITVPYIMTEQEMDSCFLRLCQSAVYVHQEELARGFITTAQGIRVGVAGRAVVKNGEIVSYRQISSLCIRFSRVIKGCAEGLLKYIDNGEELSGLLLCGAPSCGKTTVLRDLALSLSMRYNVTVVDERRELAMGGLENCDVLVGTPKTVGMLQAIRTLSPDIIIVDELGEDADWEAVGECVWRGVYVIASAHIGSEEAVRRLPRLKSLLQNGGFSLAAWMPPARRCREATRLWKARELFEDHRDPIDRVFLRGSRGHSNIENEKR